MTTLPQAVQAPDVEICPHCETARAGKFIVLRLCQRHRDQDDVDDQGFVRLDELLEDIRDDLDIIDGEDVKDDVAEFYR